MLPSHVSPQPSLPRRWRILASRSRRAPWRIASPIALKLLLTYVAVVPDSARAATVVAMFQDGVFPDAGYRGTRDTYLSEQLPDANYGTNSQLLADGSGPSDSGLDRAILMQWDLSEMPPDSTVTSVWTVVNITAEILTATYEMYELRRPWAEQGASWNSAGADAGQAWEVPGARGPTDRGSKVLGVFSATQLGTYTVPLTDAGVAVVQSWVRQPALNFGVIVHDTNHSNSQQFSSREAAQGVRPRLVIGYEAFDGGEADAGFEAGPSAWDLRVGAGCASAPWTEFALTFLGALSLGAWAGATRRKT
jgi:hypothetical protein